MTKLSSNNWGGHYVSPQTEELALRSYAVLCDSETADSINVLTEDDVDDYSDYQPW